MKTQTATKQVHIVARYATKEYARAGVSLINYKVRSSDGKTTYCTRLLNGKAQCCSCPATKPCYHMVQLEQIEARRAATAREVYCTQFAIYA